VTGVGGGGVDGMTMRGLYEFGRSRQIIYRTTRYFKLRLHF
jgi:hypothetical protein